MGKLARVSRLCKDEKDALYVSLLGVRELDDTVRRADEHRDLDYDHWEGILLHLQAECGRNRKKGKGRDFAPGVLRKDVVQQREEFIADLTAFATESGAELAALLQAEMRDLVDIYNSRKRASGKPDFVDLLLIAG